MNTLQFAVASIVDVNTGNGLVRHSDIRENMPLEQHGRRIRTISIVSFIAAFKTKLVTAIDGYRTRVK